MGSRNIPPPPCPAVALRDLALMLVGAIAPSGDATDALAHEERGGYRRRTNGAVGAGEGVAPGVGWD